jgi:hypothetical protein
MLVAMNLRTMDLVTGPQVTPYFDYMVADAHDAWVLANLLWAGEREETLSSLAQRCGMEWVDAADSIAILNTLDAFVGTRCFTAMSIAWDMPASPDSLISWCLSPHCERAMFASPMTFVHDTEERIEWLRDQLAQLSSKKVKA